MSEEGFVGRNKRELGEGLKKAGSEFLNNEEKRLKDCLLYTSPSPRD